MGRQPLVSIKSTATSLAGSCGGYKNTAAHHVVAAGLEHQGVANPVEFAQKMLAFFAHVCPDQVGPAARYKSDGVATGVGVYAEEGFNGHYCLLVELGIWLFEHPSLSTRITKSPNKQIHDHGAKIGQVFRKNKDFCPH
jgi:hypothetical protein